VRTIIQMVQLTRLDCAIASAGLMRMALAQALHHARHRIVFQKRLVDQPMMAGVLADMALEAEPRLRLSCGSAVRSIWPRLIKPRRRGRALLTPAVKFWICKRAPAFVYEAMECLGGQWLCRGQPVAAALSRSPVNAIWEGSGNVMALDVLRRGDLESAQAGA